MSCSSGDSGSLEVFALFYSVFVSYIWTGPVEKFEGKRQCQDKRQCPPFRVFSKGRTETNHNLLLHLPFHRASAVQRRGNLQVADFFRTQAQVKAAASFTVIHQTPENRLRYLSHLLWKQTTIPSSPLIWLNYDLWPRRMAFRKNTVFKYSFTKTFWHLLNVFTKFKTGNQIVQKKVYYAATSTTWRAALLKSKRIDKHLWKIP